MSEELVKKIEQMLHEEKWTRTAIGVYTVSHIKELDHLLQQVYAAGIHSEVLGLCEEHLSESKESIIGLYLSGMISLDQGSLDDSNLVRLLSLFSKNLKWQVVEHICLEILKSGENKLALRTLIDCYKTEDKTAELLDVEERLIKVDLEEADIVFALAQRAEHEKAIDKATGYYKKAIHRYISKKNFNRVREIWLKLLDYIPGEIDYLEQIEGKVSKNMGIEKSALLLEDLYPRYFADEKWDNAIKVQLKLNTYENKSSTIRKEIIECLKRKHADNPKTDEYIRLANLGESWKSLTDALEDFKKQMAYEKGNFVFHKTWGVGRIKEVREQDFIIDFEQKRAQTMGKKMAVEALESLPKDHIKVILATMKKEDLKEKLKKDVDWALKVIIRSFGNSADMKKMKAVLVPKVFEEKDWVNWSSQARSLLKTSTDYAMSSQKQDEYTVRAKPISREEKAYLRFKSENDFFKRVEVLEEFQTIDDYFDSEFFPEIFQTFANALKINKVNEEVIAAYLIVTKLVKKHPSLRIETIRSFSEYFSEIEDLDEMFSKLNSTELKEDFLQNVRVSVDHWPEVYAKLFPKVTTEKMIKDLLNHGHIKIVETLFQTAVDKYKEDRETFVWVARYLLEKELAETYGIKVEKLIICMIHLLDLTYRDINNKKDLSFAKKINNNLRKFLIEKDKKLEAYLNTAGQDSTARVFSLLNDVRDLPQGLKDEIRKLVTQKFPKMKLETVEIEKTVSTRKGTLVTLKMFNLKNKERQHIIDVEVPKNSKEIGSAMALGDLKENAEYHAAKERQVILSATVTQLTKEIESANVVEMKDVDPSKISFGTKVTLTNHMDGKKETYTILGPWESDPTNNIISYLSPLGDKLLNAKVGENLKFTINERKCDFQVESIEVAEF